MFRRTFTAAAKLPPAALYQALVARAPQKAFFGVPDSLLKDFCAYVTANVPAGQHVIAANEGNAVSMALGYHLATGDAPVVYMQNSGFGNAVNPLLSLAHRDVYKVPMLLVVGWRGDPEGKKDEPQHVAQGRLMPECLASAEVPYSVLEPCDDPVAAMETAIAKAEAHFAEHGTPYALLVKRDTFEGYKLPPAAPKEGGPTMAREAAIEQVLSLLGDDAVVVGTTGMPSREIFECRARAKAGHHRDFLTVGGMGHASSIAAGIATALQARDDARDVLCLDGDGAVLMHMGAMAVNGGEAALNAGHLRRLKHVVVNNAAHDSVGGQPTVGRAVNLTGVAAACGYKVIRSAPAATPEEVAAAMAELTAAEGPAFLEISVKKGNRADLGRPTTTPVANKEALMEFMRQK